MTYPTVDAGEYRNGRPPPGAISAPSTRGERLRAALILAGLVSLVAVFWIAVIRLVAIA